MSELYNRINRLCKERGTNVTALCKKAGVSRATLSELNAGRTKTLTLETGAKLASTLGITVDELMEAEKAPAPEGELGAKLAELVPGMTDIQKKAVQIVLRADEDWLKAFIRLAEKE